MVEEPVPEVLIRHRIPGPVGWLGVLEDDARLGVPGRIVVPHVEVALRATLGRASRTLEPGVLVAGVVDHELGDHVQPAPVGLVQELAEVVERAVGGVYLGVARDVVTVVLERAGVEGQQTERAHPELLKVVQLLRQPAEVTDAVSVGVEETPHVQLVDDRVLVPELVVEGLRLPRQCREGGRIRGVAGTGRSHQS